MRFFQPDSNPRNLSIGLSELPLRGRTGVASKLSAFSLASGDAGLNRLSLLASIGGILQESAAAVMARPYHHLCVCRSFSMAPGRQLKIVGARVAVTWARFCEFGISYDPDSAVSKGRTTARALRGDKIHKLLNGGIGIVIRHFDLGRRFGHGYRAVLIPKASRLPNGLQKVSIGPASVLVSHP
jgi:hypothetical protein